MAIRAPERCLRKHAFPLGSDLVLFIAVVSDRQPRCDALRRCLEHAHRRIGLHVRDACEFEVDWPHWLLFATTWPASSILRVIVTNAVSKWKRFPQFCCLGCHFSRKKPLFVRFLNNGFMLPLSAESKQTVGARHFAGHPHQRTAWTLARHKLHYVKGFAFLAKLRNIVGLRRLRDR